MEKFRERRKHARIPVMLKVEYTIGQENKTGFTTDISQSGLFLNTDQQPGDSNVLRLKFMLPGFEKPMFFLGKIVRNVCFSKPFRGLGIEFLSSGSKSYESVGEFVKRFHEPQDCSPNLFEHIAGAT